MCGDFVRMTSLSIREVDAEANGVRITPRRGRSAALNSRRLDKPKRVCRCVNSLRCESPLRENGKPECAAECPPPHHSPRASAAARRCAVIFASLPEPLATSVEKTDASCRSSLTTVQDDRDCLAQNVTFRRFGHIDRLQFGEIRTARSWTNQRDLPATRSCRSVCADGTPRRASRRSECKSLNAPFVATESA